MPITLVFACVSIQDLKIASNKDLSPFNVKWNETKIALTI